MQRYRRDDDPGAKRAQFRERLKAIGRELNALDQQREDHALAAASGDASAAKAIADIDAKAGNLKAEHATLEAAIAALDKQAEAATTAHRVAGQQALQRFRFRLMDARLAELGPILGATRDGTSPRLQELVTERGHLRQLRGPLASMPEAPTVLPRPRDANEERQLSLLKGEVRERIRQALAFIKRLEEEGDHRNARLHRQQLIDLGDEVCFELAIDPVLLDAVELPGERRTNPHAGVAKHAEQPSRRRERRAAQNP